MPTDREKLTFRIATPEDAPALLAIYAPCVEKTAITFEYEVPSAEEFADRIASTLHTYPYIVAEMGGKLVAYAYAGVFHAREAYSHTVETSIYVAEDVRTMGVGTLLYTALENVLLAQNIFNLYACIAVPACENDPYLTNGSVLFHEKCGYKLAGRFAGCGYKFNRWYDMVLMEKFQGGHDKRLANFAAAPAADDVPPFIPFPQLDPRKVRKLLQSGLKGECEDARRVTNSAGAVVFRSTDEGLKVLMITMKKTRHSFPKGHIDQGESMEQAAKREILEETGIEVSILPDFCYEVPSVRKTDNRSVFFFLAEYASGELAAQEDEIDAAAWVPAHEAAARASFGNDAAMYEAALEAYLSRK